MQLVAVEIADEVRRIEQRPRPARRRALDLSQRLAAFDRNRKQSRWRRHGRAAAPATRRRPRHKASTARSRNSPAETRSACCRPCPSPPPAPARAASVFPPNRATETIDERRAPPPESPSRFACRPTIARSATDPAPRPRRRVPSATFDINWSRNGRRSVPPNAIAVSLANPIRSAQG